MQSLSFQSKKDEESNVNVDGIHKDYQYNQERIAQKEILEYIQEKKEIYENLMNFLENNDNNEKYFKKIINDISKQQHEEPQEKLGKFLQLLVNVANNIHRSQSLFNKIFQIIEYYEDQIKQTFSNITIFNTFQSNKKLLLFLFKKRIIVIDNIISNELLSKNEFNGNDYCHFFYPEIKKFIDKENIKSIEKELLEIDSNIFDHFDEKREEGENDTFICSLIRKDSVEEFISYVNRANISLNSEINHSIFETNSFLIENKNISLIEYASFFGSIQILQYLNMNKIELKSSLWLYAIHSRNAELFHLLEENKADPLDFNSDDSKFNHFLKCFCESVKCHHNEFASYIEDNFLIQNKDKIRKNNDVLSSIIQFHNYAYFPTDLEDEDEFFILVSNDYHKLVNLFIKKKEETIRKEISEKINIYEFYKITLKKAANENKFEIIYFLLLGQKSIPGNCFQGLKKLNKIAIPSSVTSIGQHDFSECSSLTQIIIPSSVTSIGENAFSWCSSLTKITIPSSVTSIGNYAFSECSSLAQITIPFSVTKIGRYAFSECSALTQITIPSSVTKIGENAFSKCSSLTKITIPSSVRKIGDFAFLQCSLLAQITIPPFLSLIEDYTFFKCSSLTQITIPSSVTKIGMRAFSESIGLKHVTFTIPSSVTSIEEYAFLSCSSLIEIIIPSSVTIIKKSAFAECSSLSKVSIPSSEIRICDFAFSECSSLTQITIPSSVSFIGKDAFSKCSSLSQIVIPFSITSIKNYAFSECSSIKEITIPSSVTKIGSFAFYKCSTLTQIVIPSSVTRIGEYAFSKCSSLKQITIPSSVSLIERDAFNRCSSLTQIKIPSSITSIKSSNFY